MHPNHTTRRPRGTPAAALVLVAAAAALAACVPPTGGGSGPTTPTFRHGRCAGTEGVTIVVDLAAFDGTVVVRCALGTQSSGFTTLADAGFTTDPGRHPGTVCQLNGLPSQGHPYCWTTGGYWTYWKAPAAGQPWTYSEWGPGAGPAPAPGAVEGWRFVLFSAGPAVPPRVGTSGPIVP